MATEIKTKQEEIREGIKQLFRENFYADGWHQPICDVDLTTEFLLDYLHSQGVVLKVERELPYSVEDSFVSPEAMETIKKAGFTATGPLI